MKVYKVKKNLKNYIGPLITESGFQYAIEGYEDEYILLSSNASGSLIHKLIKLSKCKMQEFESDDPSIPVVPLFLVKNKRNLRAYLKKRKIKKYKILDEDYQDFLIYYGYTQDESLSMSNNTIFKEIN